MVAPGVKRIMIRPGTPHKRERGKATPQSGPLNSTSAPGMHSHTETQYDITDMHIMYTQSNQYINKYSTR